MTKTLRTILLCAAFAAHLPTSPSSANVSDKPSLAVIPLRLNAPSGLDYLKGAYVDILSARLTEAGVRVEDQAKIQTAIEKQGAPTWSEESKKTLARETGAAFILEGSLSVIGEDLSLDIKLIKTVSWSVSPMSYKGKGLGSFPEMLEKLAADTKGIMAGNVVAKPGDINPEKKATPSLTVPKDTGWKGRRLPLALKGFEIADFDNDGVHELAAIDDKNLYIYSLDKEGLKLKNEIKGADTSWIYNISVGDFNGNGLPEIYLSRKFMEKAATRVFEYAGKDFAVIADDLPWFVRVVKGPENASLLGETFRQIDGLFGGVKLLKWKDRAIEEDVLLDIPKWMHLYGFTILDVTGDGREDFIYLDDNDRLMVYEKDETGTWRQTWKSYKYYGGSSNNIEFGPVGQEKKTINIQVEMVSGRAFEDGRRELIVLSNEPSSRIFKNISKYESGEIRCLVWSEAGLEEIRQTKRVSGYLADYATMDLNNDGIDEILTLIVLKKPSLFNDGESLITALPINVDPSK